MTVREAITMSATLRLSKDISPEAKNKKVEEIIHILNLTKCADTVVGDTNIKGISGGERKRTAMAMEMITNPCILFLDEPTSGLDTFTAYSVVSILKELAESGRTVVATIHQPSSDVLYVVELHLVAFNSSAICLTIFCSFRKAKSSIRGQPIMPSTISRDTASNVLSIQTRRITFS